MTKRTSSLLLLCALLVGCGPSLDDESQAGPGAVRLRAPQNFDVIAGDGSLRFVWDTSNEGRHHVQEIRIYRAPVAAFTQFGAMAGRELSGFVDASGDNMFDADGSDASITPWQRITDLEGLDFPGESQSHVINGVTNGKGYVYAMTFVAKLAKQESLGSGLVQAAARPEAKGLALRFSPYAATDASWGGGDSIAMDDLGSVACAAGAIADCQGDVLIATQRTASLGADGLVEGDGIAIAIPLPGVEAAWLGQPDDINEIRDATRWQYIASGAVLPLSGPGVLVLRRLSDKRHGRVHIQQLDIAFGTASYDLVVQTSAELPTQF